jgi:pyrroline-5-carboxylate reductase
MNDNNQKIAFIGGGNMAEAIINATLKHKVAQAADIVVSDKKAERRQYIANKFNLAVTDDNIVAVKDAKTVILAIKPQDLTALMAQLNGKIAADAVVLSIIAGAKLDTIASGLNILKVVRVMPNTPAQVGQGMSVWTATVTVSDGEKGKVAAMLRAMGREIFAADEKYIDMATAVSGSGPAYVFYFAEALEKAALEIGFSGEEARELALQTLYGAATYLKNSGLPAAELRKNVTSPGGTTAAAIAEFENGGLTELIERGVKAALNRARELG